jgi:membrane dipeptidase
MGIVVDIGGHTGERASLDVLAISQGMPVISSHTNCRALVDNPRNTTDRVIEGIAATGGVVGMTALNDFLIRKRDDTHIRSSPQVGLDALLDHYDHIKRLVGADHVAIGTDFTAGFPGTDPYQGSFTAPPTVYSAQEEGWVYVRGFENIGELPNLVEGLRRRGWTHEEIGKVMGENWLRVFRQVWGS